MYSFARRTASLNPSSSIVDVKPSSPSASSGPGAAIGRGAGARTGRESFASVMPIFSAARS